MGVWAYFVYAAVGGFIGSFFGIAGMGGAIAGTIPGVFLGIAVAHATRSKTSEGDEAFYAQVAAEWEQGQIDHALLAKMQTKAQFDEKRAMARYIEERVLQLKREASHATRLRTNQIEDQKRKADAEARAQVDQRLLTEIESISVTQQWMGEALLRAMRRTAIAGALLGAVISPVGGYLFSDSFNEDMGLGLAIAGTIVGTFLGWAVVISSENSKQLLRLTAAKKRLIAQHSAGKRGFNPILVSLTAFGLIFLVVIAIF